MTRWVALIALLAAGCASSRARYAPVTRDARLVGAWRAIEARVAAAPRPTAAT